MSYHKEHRPLTKLEDNTVGQFPKVHVEGWWRNEENEENEQ